MEDKKEPLIPVDKVLDDMYDPNGGMVADAARSYYYVHYATEAEKAAMDREDMVNRWIARVVGFALGAMMLIAAMKALGM